MSNGTRISVGLGIAFGVALGVTVGAIAGASVASWTGGLVGAYGGVVCGMCVVGGLVGVIARGVDQKDRAEAILMLVYGVFAIAGAVSGYWLGTLGIPRVTPLFGFFAGLVLPGGIAAIVAARILGDRADPAILLLLFVRPDGCWARRLAGHSDRLAGSGRRRADRRQRSVQCDGAFHERGRHTCGLPSLRSREPPSR